MNRGWARTLAFSSLVPLLASVGCDALTVRPFAGAIMQMTFEAVDVTPPGQHLELWARTKYNDLVRVNAYYDPQKTKTTYGLMVRKALTLDDPCLIQTTGPTAGALLTTAAAYPSSVTIAGVTQTPDQQAQQVVDRINQLNPVTGSLLAVVPYDATPVPTIAPDATPAERLQACLDWWKSDPLAYTGSPYQQTAPLHGVVYGFVGFVSISPPASYDGFRMDTPINLDGVQEIFFTTETDNVDPMNRGPLFLTSTLTPGGRDVVHFDLTHADPNSTAAGTAALYVNLDQDPVQF